jgi:hypothetical protein
MEHVTPDMVANRLASFLGDPTTGPTGKPIPGGPTLTPSTAVALSDIAVGETVTVETVQAKHLAFLRSQGIDRGAEILVLGSGADDSVLVTGPKGTLHLATGVASTLQVVRAQ